MLVELSMVEQRYQAVREVIDTGDSITDVARRYGVDRRTLHRWLTRYANGGLEALATRSNKPDTCPHQMDPVMEARLVVLRRSHPRWGPSCAMSSKTLRHVRRSIARSCVTSSSSRSRPSALRLVTNDGNDQGPWSSGRWTW